MASAHPLDPDITYLVESDEDPTVLLAIEARITENGAEWFDSVRDRCVGVEGIEAKPGLVIVNGERATYRFRPLTLALYNQHVISHVAGNPSFGNDGELNDFYRRYPR